MMKMRKLFMTSVVAGVLPFAVGTAWAAPPTVEIVAMAHPPVQAALKPLRNWLGLQGGKLRVIELNAESPTGEKRLQSVGLTGHVPILILIDGKYDFRRKDGSKVAFVNFPAVDGSPPGVRSNWVAGDVEAQLTARMR